MKHSGTAQWSQGTQSWLQQQISRSKSCGARPALDPCSRRHPDWAASTLPCTQPQDQSFGRSLPLESVFTSLSLLALEMSTAALTSKGNRAAGRWVYLHTATQQVGDRAAQEPGSCWPARGREHTVLL